MSKPISAHWIWTREDLAEGRRFFSRHVSGLRRFGAWLIISAVAAFWIIEGAAKGDWAAGGFTAALLISATLIATLAGRFLVSPYLRKREFEKRPDANTPLDWQISSEMIVVVSSASRSEINWSAFYKVIADPSGFLFLPNAQIFHFIPNRAFASQEDIDTVRELAAKNAKIYKQV